MNGLSRIQVAKVVELDSTEKKSKQNKKIEAVNQQNLTFDIYISGFSCSMHNRIMPLKKNQRWRKQSQPGKKKAFLCFKQMNVQDNDIKKKKKKIAKKTESLWAE